MRIKYNKETYSKEEIMKMDVLKMPFWLFFKANIVFVLPKFLILFLMFFGFILLIKFIFGVI